MVVLTHTQQLHLWLNEARAAYHDLNMGRRAKVFVDQNGERIEYEGSTRGQLLAYIRELERQLGIGSVIGPSTVMI